MIEKVRYVLSRLDHDEKPVVAAVELKRWPPEAAEFFINEGILRPIAPATSVTYYGCDEACHITPDFVEDKRTGKTVGVYFCKRPDCGLIKIDPDDMRQWEPHLEDLAAWVGADFGLKGKIKRVAPGRICLLGGLESDIGLVDVFLARGLHWPDGADVIGRADCLRTAAAPVILVPGDVPDPQPDLGGPATWVSLSGMLIDIAEVDGVPRWSQRALTDRVRTAMAVTLATRNDIPIPPLAPVDLDVLEVLSKERKVPMFQVELVEKSGYKKEAVQTAIRRLEKLGLVARPHGTKRKGIMITERGLAAFKSARTKCSHGDQA